MTDTPETPVAPPTGLGSDDTSPVVTAPVDAPVDNTPVVPDDTTPTSMTVEMDEYQSLVDARNNVQHLESDAGAMDVLRNYFNGKDTTPVEAPAVTEDNSQINETLKQITNTLQHLHARVELSDFKSSHPDFETYKETMGKLMQETPGLKLDRAFEMAKALKGPPQTPKPALQEPESRNDAGDTQFSEAAFAEELAKNPNASLDQDLQTAWNKAQELESGQS